MVFYGPIAAMTLLAGLPFLPYVAVVRWLRRRHRPHRQPSSVRVAIIGGGWSGLQLAARFQELGISWQGFEANDDFGGTWHPKNRYAGLALHTAAWLASFANFRYSSPDQRPSAAELQDYMQQFADSRDLRRGFVFNGRVAAIDADAKKRTAKLSVLREEHGRRKSETYGPYDLVIFASIAAEPHVPYLAGSSDFHGLGGRQFHASECNDEMLTRLAQGKSRVAVIGGSKSGADIVLALIERGVSCKGRLAWIYRRPYVFFKFERFFHGCRTAMGRLRGFGAFLSFCAAWAFPYLSLRFLDALDYLWVHGRARRSNSDCRPEDSPCCDVVRCAAHAAMCCTYCACCCDLCCPEPDDWKTMRYGTFDAQQRQTLDEQANALMGSPTRFLCEDHQGLGLEIELCGCKRATGARSTAGASDDEAGGTTQNNGGKYPFVPADVIIWATGYRTGIDRIQYLLDGQPVEGGPPHSGPMINNFICARFPVLAISGFLFTSSGPISARAAADLACWHLCVRPRLSTKRLKRWVRRHLKAAPPNAKDAVQGERHILFAPGFWTNVIWLQASLITDGIVPWQQVLGGLFNILVRNRQVPLELGLLGSLSPDYYSGHVESEGGALLAAGHADVQV
jgi:hypothetical protein